MRICLIGDSHAAMLIAAFRADPAGDDLTVFAKPGLADDDISLNGSVLRARTPEMLARLSEMGTPEALDLGAFDAVVIAGLTPSAFAAVRLQQNHAVAGWPSGAKAVTGALMDTPPPKSRPLMTRAAYTAALTALTETSLATRLARATSTPVVVIPQPFPSDAVMDRDDAYPIFRRLIRQRDGAALASDLIKAHRAVFDGLQNVTYLPQPADSLSQGCLTQVEFMRGGPRLSDSSNQAAQDVLHGNAQLGHRLLLDLRNLLGRPTLNGSNP